MGSIVKELYFLDINTPSFYIVRFLLKQDLGDQQLFYNRLTKGIFDRDFYDTSYISDLGLRRTNEPSIFFKSQFYSFVSKLGYFHYQFPYHDQSVQEMGDHLDWDSKTSPYDFERFVSKHLDFPAVISDVMKYYADVLGAWKDADYMSEMVLQWIEHLPNNEHTADLLSNCGNLLAHNGNPLCRKAYKRAYDLEEDPYYRFTSPFRISVAEIKRLNDPENILPSLKLARSAANEFGEIVNSEDNAVFCNGLIDNLEALYYMKQGNMTHAKTAISRAWSSVSSVSSEKLFIESDIANRYRIQIIENLAFFLGLTSEWEKSIPIFLEAVDLCKKIHPDSLGEALSMLGYVLIRSGKSKEAIDVLIEAEQIRSNHVGIFKAQEVRKMLAVAYDDIGDEMSSNYWIEKIISYDEKYQLFVDNQS